MLNNTQVKYIQSLYHKKFREEYGQYVIEGPKMVEEALFAGNSGIRKIYALPSWIERRPPNVKANKAEITVVTEKEMVRISHLTTPGEALALLDIPVPVVPEEFHGLTLLLDKIQDPGNLGTIIRTADWFGVRQLVCGEGTADCYNPKVIQSTMGSIFRVGIFYTSLNNILAAHPRIPVLVGSLSGTTLQRGEHWKDAFLVIGNESRGVSTEILEKASRQILIPGHGVAESLNAAVATGILLYALTSREK